jgi:hypothetical protein
MKIIVRSQLYLYVVLLADYIYTHLKCSLGKQTGKHRPLYAQIGFSGLLELLRFVKRMLILQGQK